MSIIGVFIYKRHVAIYMTNIIYMVYSTNMLLYVNHKITNHGATITGLPLYLETWNLRNFGKKLEKP